MQPDQLTQNLIPSPRRLGGTTSPRRLTSPLPRAANQPGWRQPLSVAARTGCIASGASTPGAVAPPPPLTPPQNVGFAVPGLIGKGAARGTSWKASPPPAQLSRKNASPPGARNAATSRVSAGSPAPTGALEDTFRDIVEKQVQQLLSFLEASLDDRFADFEQKLAGRDAVSASNTGVESAVEHPDCQGGRGGKSPRKPDGLASKWMEEEFRLREVAAEIQAELYGSRSEFARSHQELHCTLKDLKVQLSEIRVGMQPSTISITEIAKEVQQVVVPQVLQEVSSAAELAIADLQTVVKHHSHACEEQRRLQESFSHEKPCALRFEAESLEVSSTAASSPGVEITGQGFARGVGVPAWVISSVDTLCQRSQAFERRVQVTEDQLHGVNEFLQKLNSNLEALSRRIESEFDSKVRVSLSDDSPVRPVVQQFPAVSAKVFADGCVAGLRPAITSRGASTLSQRRVGGL